MRSASPIGMEMVRMPGGAGISYTVKLEHDLLMEVGKPKRSGRENITGKTDRMMCIPRVMASSPCVTPLFFLAYFPCSPLSSLTFLPLLPTLFLSGTTTAARPVFASLDPKGHSPQGPGEPTAIKEGKNKGCGAAHAGQTRVKAK